MLLSPKIFPTNAILNLSIKADAEVRCPKDLVLCSEHVKSFLSSAKDSVGFCLLLQPTFFMYVEH